MNFDPFYGNFKGNGFAQSLPRLDVQLNGILEIFDGFWICFPLRIAPLQSGTGGDIDTVIVLLDNDCELEV